MISTDQLTSLPCERDRHQNCHMIGCECNCHVVRNRPHPSDIKPNWDAFKQALTTTRTDD